jgi:ParB/RepB/Spo0J family partition protein
VRHRDTTPDTTTSAPAGGSAFIATDDPTDDGPAEGCREGLPDTYRSRYTPHYVEELTANSSSQPVRLLLINQIEAPPLTVDATLDDLARSIEEVGVLHPLLVRPRNGRFALIAGRRRLAAARRAGLSAVPCLVHPVDEARAVLLATADNLRGDGAAVAQAPAGDLDNPELTDPRTSRLIAELHDVVAGIQASLQQVSLPAATRDRITLRLLTAEAARAEWLLRARQYLGSTPLLAHAAFPGAMLVSEVERVAGSAIAVRGGTLHAQAGRRSPIIHGDRTLLATAAVGLTWAVFALGERIQDARVQLRLGIPSDGRSPVLTITQPSAVLVQRGVLRFFDAGWSERPGGTIAELAVRLARQAAAFHGARLEVSSRPGSGTRVSMTFNANG